MNKEQFINLKKEDFPLKGKIQYGASAGGIRIFTGFSSLTDCLREEYGGDYQYDNVEILEIKLNVHKLRGVAHTRQIWLDGRELTPNRSLKYYSHSPDGFNWGYSGSGPAQLALAIFLKLKNKSDGYQEFKSHVIAKLPQGKDFEVLFNLDDLSSFNPEENSIVEFNYEKEKEELLNILRKSSEKSNIILNKLLNMENTAHHVKQTRGYIDLRNSVDESIHQIQSVK